MADIVSKSIRSEIMAKVRSCGNKSTELKLIYLFRQYSIIGWRRNYKLTGKPDFVFPQKRIAIFVDGCFWHGCPRHCRMPKSNHRFWTNKIVENKQRDLYVNRTLKQSQWSILRLWEHQLGNRKLPKRFFKWLK
ncbi:MAG: very short patch repair endonuclease [bacterium]|nr:very short patch repair endonuclease [bacterium]